MGNNNTLFYPNTYLFGSSNVGLVSGTAIGRNLFIDSSNALYVGQNNNFSVDNPSKNAFVVGWGTVKTPRNVFRVDTEGGVFAQKEYNATGADYAEYFEWKDSNPNDEDRVGYFVTLDGDKISIAKEGDWILGVISAQASIVGDSYDDDWHDKYLTDEFGRIVYEEVTIPADGDTEEHVEMQPRINPKYDDEKEYIPRSERKEWGIVGLMGKLFVHDDGKCKVNEFCKTGDGGIAVPAENGYRVMKRVSDSIIQILIK